jgi:nitrogen fixation/metabolism regulation signal transduction histidine kinase
MTERRQVPQQRDERARLRLWLWVGGVGAGTFALGCLTAAAQSSLSIATGAVASASLLVLALRRLEQRAAHPLRTAANVLDALRHGDYTQRARTDVIAGPASDLLAEVNQLADHLQAERVRAAETAALLQALVQRVDVALLTFDDGAVLRWWNPAAERLFQPHLREGLRARELGVEELLGGAVERSVSLPGVAVLDQHVPSAWQLRRGVFHRAGQRYQFLLLSSVQRVRREEERAAWQRLVRVLGHEVNNTLAPIQSLAATCRDMLADEGAAAVPEVLSALAVVEQRAHGLGHFISEFARLARLPEPRLERLELGAEVRRVAPLDARCPVHVVGKQSVELFADRPLLEQALLNLIRNAVDASVARSGAVTIDWHADADLAVLSISDEGDGIANPDNLFVPLFSTKPGGSGIGLVLARNIVEAHGGQLRLDNRSQAAGCIARVTLPRAPRLDANGGVGDRASAP